MTHHCHAIGCERIVPPRLFFMCPPHWKRLPKKHQGAIWSTYRRGQEISKTPSLPYIVAQTEAVLTMAILDDVTPDKIERQRALLDWAKAKLAKYGPQNHRLPKMESER
jgi:hypothetical protein